MKSSHASLIFVTQQLRFNSNKFIHYSQGAFTCFMFKAHGFKFKGMLMTEKKVLYKVVYVRCLSQKPTCHEDDSCEILSF